LTEDGKRCTGVWYSVAGDVRAAQVAREAHPRS
jgi:hypothetical protein